MNRQVSYGAAGFARVEVEAEGLTGPLPKWVDTGLMVEAALAEYERQRSEAGLHLPTQATREAF